MEQLITKRELFPFQKEGVEFLKKTKKAILADSMGLGKTFQAVAAAGEVGQGVLVICPASLKINWKREIEIVYPDDEVTIISSDSNFTGNPNKKWWVIINYDIIEKKLDLIEQLIGGGIDTLILDEAHYIKGKSIRTAAIVGGSAKKKIGGVETTVKYKGIAEKMKNVYMLTGTPILNRPIELFNLLKAIGHEMGANRKAYSERYCGGYLKTIFRKYGGVLRYWDESGATNLDELRIKIKPFFLRRKKKDVLDLPEKIVSIMECEMKPEWKKVYDTAWDNYIQFLEENPMPEKNLDNILMARQLVEIQKLKQVCSQSKIDRIISDIENTIEQDEKVIVFTQYTETINQLRAGLSEKKIGWAKLTGEDDMSVRQFAVDNFQNDPRTKVFLANIKAGGVGLNLTAASIVMFADMEWSPEIHEQCIDRAHRIGQTGTVNAYFYVAIGTIEEDIINLLSAKKQTIDIILEGGKVKKRDIFRMFIDKLSNRVVK